MKIIKFLLITAIAFLIGLSYLLTTLQNPLEQKYNKIVQRIMEKEELLNEKEVIIQYPELKELKVQIQDIKKKHHDIQQIPQQPMPPNEEQSLYLMSKLNNLERMKEEVQFRMNQIVLRGVVFKQSDTTIKKILITGQGVTKNALTSKVTLK